MLVEEDIEVDELSGVLDDLLDSLEDEVQEKLDIDETELDVL